MTHLRDSRLEKFFFNLKIFIQVKVSDNFQSSVERRVIKNFCSQNRSLIDRHWPN